MVLRNNFPDNGVLDADHNAADGVRDLRRVGEERLHRRVHRAAGGPGGNRREERRAQGRGEHLRILSRASQVPLAKK